ncbi:MAG: hypothetical protein HY319_13045 [Armatimonadetes bacterium]|nr:hypothetical protein [Armatimonadota bacterium]
MTREDVEQRFATFLGLLDREQALKEELLHLKLRGRREEQAEVAERLRRHDEILEEIEDIRHREMLPILEELARFIASGGVNRVH